MLDVLDDVLDDALEELGGNSWHTFPPLGPPDGDVDSLVFAASERKASSVLGPEAGGLMTATMPDAQCGLGLFCEQYSQMGFASVTVMVKVVFCATS